MRRRPSPSTWAARLAVPLLLAAAPVPPATGSDGTATLAADTETRWVPFELTAGNQILFAMSLEGQPVTAILDTGVSFSVLAKGSPAAVAARIRPSGNATAIGGAVAIGWMPTGSLAIGGLTRMGGGVTVAALPALATGSARAVDLLIGRDVIGGQALDIDYAQHRFRLLPPGRLPFRGATAPLTISPSRRIYESAIALGGHALAPMVVDTGDGSAITVSQRAWREAAGALPTTTAVSFGLAGPVVSDLAIVSGLRLGERVAREVEVRIEPEGGFSESIGVAGRIGSGFLQHYRVLLDPGAGRMVLSANADADEPPLRSTSGLLVGVLADRLRVLHVMRGSPAAAEGWRNGDTICSVDGAAIPADYARNRMAGWSVATPGTVVRLGMCDGSARSLTTRAFY